jgi:FkbM family methyltransferase
VGRNRFKNIFVEKKGLSDRKGILPLYGSDSKDQLGAKNQGLPTLHPRPGVDRPLEEIELFRLDDYVRDLNLEKIDVIKIDVEGSELAVLKGAIEVLKKFRPLIFLEVSKETSEAAQYTTSDLINYVTAQGYRFEAILEGGRTRPWTANDGVPPRDMLCIPTEH